MTVFFFGIWLGGIAVSYRAYRGHGHGALSSALSAAVWSIDLGRTIALATYKRVDPE